MTPKNKIELKLQRIYKELDEELASASGGSPGCDACGECCNFAKFDHVLYATTIEVDYIKRNVSEVGARCNVPLQSASDGSHKDVCPFLVDKKCSIRDYRTLGCRVFFCNPNYQRNLSQEIYNKYYRKIKDLANTHDLEWRYAPFLELLY
ncbi:MAG TPA: hypothetical protein ACFYD6_04440 [Candidatus Brocadiia bacterium]|nr:hypothetical protein [Planctomycetota bacterium]MDO8092817.1 hypothetical protein [Candidatus Brocadiales bacterium]